MITVDESIKRLHYIAQRDFAAINCKGFTETGLFLKEVALLLRQL